MRTSCLAAFGLASSLLAFAALGHGIDLPKPTLAQLAQTQPPLKGSVEFSSELLAHLRNRLAQDQLVLLDQVMAKFAAENRIREGEVRGSSPRDADYHHWQAEQSLLKLLPQIPQMLQLDFREGGTKSDPDRVVELDQQYDQILIEVISGNGATNFVVQQMNMTSERDQSPYTITVASNATTYIVVNLEQVPSGRTIFRIIFRDESSATPIFTWPFSFVSKPSGQLGVTVLDELGKQVPVLMRLTAKPSQKLFEPAGSIDLSPMMNDITSLPIYGPGRGYMVYIPGPFKGRYWVVPKTFEMAVPAGDWEIHVIHGIEYVPVHENFRVESGQWTRRTIRLKRWANMPQKGWFSGDDHVHSRLMSSEDAEKLLAFSKAGDIHLVNVLEMGDEMRTWYAQRGFGAEFRVHDQQKLHWLVPGQEDPRSMLGHAIGLNLKAKVRDLDRYYLNDWVAGEIHRQGGLYGHTHVGAKALSVEREMALFTPMEIVDFNSIMQAALNTDYFYDFLNMGFKMTASAGTDTPYGGTVGAVRVYAYCGTDKPFAPDKWFSALKAGHTFVTTGPMVDFSIDGARPGDQLDVVNKKTFKAKARAWGLHGESAPAILQLIKFGRVIAEATSTNSNKNELNLEVELPTEESGWIAAHVVGVNGSEAHTTPIYLVKHGLRFWDVNQAGALIQKQLAVLDDIHESIQKAQLAMKKESRSLDYWNRWPAEQAAALEERLTKVRSLYQRLREDLDTEIGTRVKVN